jgi:hypothetical protein
MISRSRANDLSRYQTLETIEKTIKSERSISLPSIRNRGRDHRGQSVRTSTVNGLSFCRASGTLGENIEAIERSTGSDSSIDSELSLVTEHGAQSITRSPLISLLTATNLFRCRTRGTAIEIETIEGNGKDGSGCSRSRANDFSRFETLGIVCETIKDNR